MNINDLKIGETAIITNINTTGVLHLRLLDLGLIPNTKIKLQKIAPLGDPIQIQVRRYELIIRKHDAGKIQIKKGESKK